MERTAKFCDVCNSTYDVGDAGKDGSVVSGVEYYFKDTTNNHTFKMILPVSIMFYDDYKRRDRKVEHVCKQCVYAAKDSAFRCIAEYAVKAEE